VLEVLSDIRPVEVAYSAAYLRGRHLLPMGQEHFGLVRAVLMVSGRAKRWCGGGRDVAVMVE